MEQISVFDILEPTRMCEISYDCAVDFLLPKHYSGRIPQITIAFGWYIDGELVAVCSFGKPASNDLCIGVCGKKWATNVYELNRLCRVESLSQPLSMFVGWVLRQLREKNWIIVSYSDTAMKHNGYIYQATNFMYTGHTKERTDKYTEGNRHSRHYDNGNQLGLRKFRTAKNRYVYFCTKDKRLKREWLEDLRYKPQPYPKEQNCNYVLGEYQKPIIIQRKS